MEEDHTAEGMEALAAVGTVHMVAAATADVMAVVDNKRANTVTEANDVCFAIGMSVRQWVENLQQLRSPQ